MSEKKPQSINWNHTFALCLWLLVMLPAIGAAAGLAVKVYHVLSESECQSQK